MQRLRTIVRPLFPNFREIAGDAPAFPLVILFLIYVMDEIDTAAFSTLGPEIRDAFHLSESRFTEIVILNASVVLLAALPIGYMGDTLRRVRLVVIFAMIAAVFSVGTGLAVGVGWLVFARIGNGIGLVANDPIHRSLLADYYPPDRRALAFATHANAARLGAILGPPIAGLIAWQLGWRAAFFILMVPIVVVTFFALRLKDPVRGATDDATSAFLAEQERAIGFGRAFRSLLAVPTLRRQFAAWLFIGPALVPLGAYGPLYFENVFNLGPVERGVIGAANAAAAFMGIQLAAGWTAGWLAKGMGEPLKRAGWVLMSVGPAVILYAWAPWLWFAITVSVTANFVGGMFTPAFFTTQALVSPARVRSTSFSIGSVFIVLGLWALFIIPGIGGIVDDHGERWAIFSLFPYWIIGGLILRSGHRFVADDAKRSLDNLQMTAQLRREREALNERSVLVVRNVDVSYGPVQVLFGVNLELQEGEIVALLGTNGAGKSTLLRAISGLVPVHGGAIFFDGDDVTGLEPEDSFAAGLVHVPGGRGIFPGLTVKENLDVAAWASGRPKADSAMALNEVVHLFPALERRMDQPAGVLSGGEQQMLTLAQAFIAKPKLLMIDELSLGLAPIVVEELLGVVRRIHDEGTAVILVEQSVNLALTVADRAVFMEKGEIRFSGPTAELLEREDILRAVFLGGIKQLEGLTK